MSIRTSVSFSALKGDLGCAVSRRVYRRQQNGRHSLPSETGLDFAPVSLCDFADIEEGIASVRWLTHPPAREVSEAEPDSIGRDRSCGPTVGPTPEFAWFWIFANRVVAGVLINTLQPRQQDTGQRTSGQQINQLEGLALARAWGF